MVRLTKGLFDPSNISLLNRQELNHTAPLMVKTSSANTLEFYFDLNTLNDTKIRDSCPSVPQWPDPPQIMLQIEFEYFLGGQGGVTFLDPFALFVKITLCIYQWLPPSGSPLGTKGKLFDLNTNILSFSPFVQHLCSIKFTMN